MGEILGTVEILDYLKTYIFNSGEYLAIYKPCSHVDRCPARCWQARRGVFLP